MLLQLLHVPDGRRAAPFSSTIRPGKKHRLLRSHRQNTAEEAGGHAGQGRGALCNPSPQVPRNVSDTTHACPNADPRKGTEFYVNEQDRDRSLTKTW